MCMCIIHEIVHVHHPSNIDGSSVSTSKVMIIVLSCEAWGTCTQCVQTLNFNVLKLNEDIALHVKKMKKKIMQYLTWFPLHCVFLLVH